MPCSNPAPAEFGSFDCCFPSSPSLQAAYRRNWVADLTEVSMYESWLAVPPAAFHVFPLSRFCPLNWLPTTSLPGPQDRCSSRRDVKMRPGVHLLLAQASPPALPHSFSSGWEPLPGSVVSLGAAERLRERYHLFCAYQLQLSSKEFSLLRSW